MLLRFFMLQLYPVLQNVGIVIPMAMFGIQAISVSTMLTAQAVPMQ